MGLETEMQDRCTSTALLMFSQEVSSCAITFLMKPACNLLSDCDSLICDPLAASLSGILEKERTLEYEENSFCSRYYIRGALGSRSPCGIRTNAQRSANRRHRA